MISWVRFINNSHFVKVMLYETVALTAIILTLCIVGRIYFGPMKDNKYKIKPRIHHGYVGLALLLISSFFSMNLLYIGGMSLFLSDALHHFVVLPFLVGRTEFP